jgi:putative heme-binding domain-containing protein
MYMIDWYDKNQCHRVEPEAHDRSNGRIFKVSYVGGQQVGQGGSDPARQKNGGTGSGNGNGGPTTKDNTKPVIPLGRDLKQLSDKQLVELELQSNDWYVRHARRILQERAAQGTLDHSIHASLAKIALENTVTTRQLRGLWALHVTGGLTDELVLKALSNQNPFVRGWAIQLAGENQEPSSELRTRYQALAKEDSSPIVRLYLASALQRMRLDDRWEILANLLKRSADGDDRNLPLMYWYAFEPLADVDANRAIHLASHARDPYLTFMARRIATAGTPAAIAEVIERLRRSDEPDVQRSILMGMNEAFKGRRQVTMPAGWGAVSQKLATSDDTQIRQIVAKLAVTFGESKAMDAMRKVLADTKGPVEERREALASLLAARDPKLAVMLQRLIAEPGLRREALRGLAAYDDPKTADVILGVYPSLSLEEKRDALNTLAARAATARSLVKSVAAKQIPMTDLSADVLRQLRNIKDEELAKQIAAVWGSLRDTAEDKVREIRRVRAMIVARQARPDELPRGRAVFAKTCQQCHTLFGTGAKIGPDLTGSNRADLEYLLTNVLDPSAVMAKEYQPNLIATTDGRVITGLVLKDDGKTLTIATANDTITLPRSDIDEMKLSDKSMMPDDLLKQLDDDDVRALVAYLASPKQVPMLANADNVKGFFNAQDLTGWEGDAELWSVENGEIVGKTAGLRQNEFLKSQLLVEDFKLSLQVKLVPNAANSGIQFRSEPLSGGEMRGPQADIGAGWWGKLYEENGRGLLWDKSGEAYVKPDEWNTYEVVATGSHIRTFINGKPCVDLDDAAVSRRGIFGLQIHSGGATEVRFKDLKLEVSQGIVSN